MARECGSADRSSSRTCRGSEAGQGINLGENMSEQGHMNDGLCANEQCLASDHWHLHSTSYMNMIIVA